MGMKKVIMDGWANLLTSIGVAGKDKRLSASVSWAPTDDATAEAIYSDDDIASKVVDHLPDEMTREWIKITNQDPDTIKKINDKMAALDIKGRLNHALKWSRLYGGAAALIVTDDGAAKLSEPLDRPSSIKALQVLSCKELHYADLDRRIDSPNFGMPLFYRLQGSDTVGADSPLNSQRIHYSRIVRFDGVKLPRRNFVANRYWGDSILTRLMNPLRNYQQSHDGAIVALQDYSVGVFKIQNLAEIIAAGREDEIRKRIELVNLSKSVIRAVVLDQAETFENITRALTGVPEILVKAGERLVAASNMPHTVLFGTSPSGLGGSGRHESQNWYDYVSNQQETTLRPAIAYLLGLIAFELKIPDVIEFDFNPLWQLDDKEEADLRKTQSETDTNYINAGVLDPDEVATSRFGSGEWSENTALDTETRAKIAKAPPAEDDEDEDDAPPATPPVKEPPADA